MNCKKLTIRTFFILAASLFSLEALAVSLTGFQAMSLSGDRTQLELTFDGPAPTPAGYSIEDPARISLDLPGIESRLENKYYQIGSGNTRNAAVVSTGDRTRVVLSLTSLVPYATSASGNTLRIVVGDGAEALLAQTEEAEATTAADSEPAASEPARADEQEELMNVSADAQAAQAPSSPDERELRNVDFRRSPEGNGQVMLEFSGTSARTDVVERGNSILITIEDYEVPSDLRRRLDVIDFSTSVHYINVYSDEGDAVIELEMDGTFEYLAYQTDNRMTVDVQTVTEEEAEAALRERFPYSGERLSLSFQDIEVRNVLQLIADYVGLNLVASDSISGNITLRLQNVPWDQALDLVLRTKGLDKRQDGNVLLVAPADELAERERMELESQQQVRELAPLVTEFIQINYAKAADILAILRSGPGGGGDGGEDGEGGDSGGSSGFLSGRGSASVDARTNTLIVRDTASNLESIREAIQRFDVAVRQVLIEARIVSARTSVGQQLGIRWGGNVNTANSSPVVASGSLDSTASIGSDLNTSGGTSYEMSYPDALAVNLPVTNPNASSFAIGVAAFDYALDLELSALETRGSAEVVSQPKVVTSNGQEAFINSGQSVAFDGGEEGTTFVDAGLSLRVTPQITPDDRVVLDLVVTQDSLAAGGGAIDTNSVTTQVLVDDGETLVLGGVYRTEQVNSVDKTPLLGDLPVLGTLFRRTSQSEEKTELLIFITPRLVQESLATN